MSLLALPWKRKESKKARKKERKKERKEGRKKERKKERKEGRKEGRKEEIKADARITNDRKVVLLLPYRTLFLHFDQSDLLNSY